MSSGAKNSYSKCGLVEGEKLDQTIIAAFQEVREGYSPDRVVADPNLNSSFIDLCCREWTDLNACLLNRRLLNARKAGLLKGLNTTRRTGFADEDEYRYASEIAARFLEKKDNVTLDDIICDPTLAAEFDVISARIAPGYSALQYRWAALNLRKSNKLKPELMSQVVRPVGLRVGSISDLNIDSLPMSQGLYVFYGRRETLYVGEASVLQNRIRKHLDHSDRKELARWFWEHGFSDVNLEIQELAPDTPKKVRRALESELISSRHPIFNVHRT